MAVCLINMFTTVMILILERTHMIGVLTVLGMSPWNQRKIFLRYAARILMGYAVGKCHWIWIVSFSKKYHLIHLSRK